MEYLEPWLESWAKWRVSDRVSLGHASSSPIHRMMTEHAETSGKKYRRRRQVLTVGLATIARHVDPVHGKPARSYRAESIEDNLHCEMMDAAVSQLEPRQQDALMLKYAVRFDDRTSAATMRVSYASYRLLVKMAMFFLDGWMRARHPEMVTSAALVIGHAANG